VLDEESARLFAVDPGVFDREDHPLGKMESKLSRPHGPVNSTV
jgi:hypothetical protein